MPDFISLQVTALQADPIEPAGGTAIVTVQSGDTVYYADTRQVSPTNNQGSLTVGQSVTFTGTTVIWLCSASRSQVQVQVQPPVQVTSGVSVGSPTSGQVPQWNGSAWVGASTVIDVQLGAYATWFDAIQAALNSASLSDYTEIVLPQGLIPINKAGQAGIQVPLNVTGHLTISGHSRGTILQMSANTPIAFQSASNSVGDTLSNITVKGIVFDAHSVTGTASQGVAAHFVLVDGNVSNVTVEDFEVLNAKNLVSGAGRRCVSISVATSTAFGVTQYTMTDIKVRKFRLGATGGGGNTGVFIAAFAQPTVANNQYYAATVTKANVWLDRIAVEDGYWTSGAMGAGGTTYASAGVQVGGDGLSGTVNVARVYCQFAGDVNFEFDSVLDLSVERCTGKDAINENFFIANNHGGLPAAFLQRHVARFRKCLSGRTTSNSSTCAGYMFQTKHGTQIGHLMLDDCAFEHAAADFRTPSGAWTNPNPAIFLMGGFRKVSVRNCRISYPNLAITATATNQTINNVGLVVQHSGDPGILEVKGLHFEATGTADNTGSFTGGVWQASAVLITSAQRLLLDIDGVTHRSNIAPLNGYATRYREVELAATTTMKLSDAFATAGTLAGDYVVDAGSIANLAQGVGVVTSAANPTTRNLLHAPMMSSVGATKDQIGVVQDGAAYAYMTTSPTLNMTSAELIARLKVNAAGTSEVRAILDSTGVRIEKVVAGVVTSLLAAQAVTQPSVGQIVGLRLKQIGNVLTADYFLTPGSEPSVTTAGTSTFTVTLAGADIPLFGATGPQGYVGWGWTPGTSDATFNGFRHDRLMVIIGGTAFGLRPLGNAVSPNGASFGFCNTSASTLVRFEGPLKVRFQRGSVTRDTNQTDISLGSDTNVTGFVQVDPGSTWSAIPNGAAITVTASPFTYLNAKPYPVRVGIFSGTVSNVSIVDAGGTSRQVAAATNVGVTLGVAESLIVTYTVAPTMNYAPVL